MTPGREGDPRTAEPAALLVTERALSLVLSALIGLVAWRAAGVLRSMTQAPADIRFMEAQHLTLRAATPLVKLHSQRMTSIRTGRWTQDDQLLVEAHRPGDFVRFELPSPGSRRARLAVALTRSYDYGIIQVLANGRPLGPPLDLWSPTIQATGAIDLGEFPVTAPATLVELRVVGSNQASNAPHYQFGIDAVRIDAAGDRAGGA